MITLKLTNGQTEEILHALRTSYLDYDEKLGASYNEAIERYNNELDELITSIKQQVKEQEQ